MSPSKPYWINYSKEKLQSIFENHKKAVLGTKIHAFVNDAITLKIRLPNNQATINSYVNDAIGFDMETEMVLYYSPNAYGTVDAISFQNNTLRIHDLKTGSTKPQSRQLEVYAALFCLEYSKIPSSIDILLSIYQNDEVLKWSPDPEDILMIMDRIVEQDARINEMEALYV